MGDKTAATPPKRGAAHERPNVFIGKWHAEGATFAVGQTKENPRGSVEKWISDETYAWLPGQFFVIQTWDAMTGANPLKGTAIISHDADTGTYMTVPTKTTGSSATTSPESTAIPGPSAAIPSALASNSRTVERRKRLRGSGASREKIGCRCVTAWRGEALSSFH